MEATWRLRTSSGLSTLIFSSSTWFGRWSCQATSTSGNSTGASAWDRGPSEVGERKFYTGPKVNLLASACSARFPLGLLNPRTILL